MNDADQPYPPLSIIEARLFGEPEAVDRDVATESKAGNAPASELPDWLQHRIRQVATQRTAARPTSPAAGQIWSLAYSGHWEGNTLAGRIPVLLAQNLGEDRWQAWVVSSDTDYAALDDVILDVEALELSPIATQVQTWNSVQVRWSTDSTFLGQLPESELVLLRQVANRPNSVSTEPGLPCRLEWRELESGRSVLTGKALGNADDPRWAYRRLYRRFALACLPELTNEQELDL